MSVRFSPEVYSLRNIRHVGNQAIVYIVVLDIFVFLIFSLIHKVSFHSPSLETKLTFLWVLYNAADNIQPISRKYLRYLLDFRFFVQFLTVSLA